MAGKFARYALILSLCLCLLPLSALAGEADVWDGTAVRPATLVEKDGVHYYEITTCEQLAWVAREGGDWLTYNYLLANDLILNETAPEWDEDGTCTNAEGLLAWTPIGISGGFTGILDGSGYTIRGLYVCEPDTYNAGLIAWMEDAVLRDLSLENAYVKSCEYGYAGGLVGDAFTSSITNCSFSGLVTADSGAGGLVLSGNNLDLENCTASGQVMSSSGLAGGLIADSGAYIVDCRAACDVISTEGCAGGLAGEVSIGGTIENSHATGSVTGDQCAGGLIGFAGGRSVTTSWASGDVTATDGPAGGLIGQVDTAFQSIIKHCYALGDVSAATCAGGLIGRYSNRYTGNWDNGIFHCYAAGEILSGETRGGFLGEDRRIWGEDFTLSFCYYLRDGAVNGDLTATGAGGADLSGEMEGKTLAQLRTKTTFAGWDFGTVWAISPGENNGLPYLLPREGEPDPNPAPACRVEGITLRDGDGNALAAIPAGDFQATVSVTALAGTDALILLGCYAGDGQFRGLLWVRAEEVPQGTTLHLTLPVDNAGGDIARLTAFAVASLDDPIPLGGAVTMD